MTRITGGLRITGNGIRLGGAAIAHSPTLSSGSYYFKIGTTGTITKNQLWDAPTTPIDPNTMTLEDNGYWDDNSVGITAPFDVTFVGTTTHLLYISGNGGFSFSNQNNMRDGNPNSGATDNNVPCLYMNNNDANLLEVYSLLTGTTGSQVYAVKVRGNTNYNNTPYNYEYDIYFYENNPGKVDVVVNQEPTNWNEYNNNAGNVLWGVTNGTSWVDGLTYHDSSIGAGSGGGGGGSSLFTPTGTAVTLSGTYPSVVYEMGNAPTSLSIPDLSGNNLTFTEYNGEAWNSNYYNYNSNKYSESDNTSFLDGITDQLTITGWFSFPAAITGSSTLVSRGSNWAFRVDGYANLLNLVKYNVADQQLSIPGGSFNTNTWHFITVSQSGGNLTFGVNGSYTSTNSGDTSNFSGTGQPVRIARDGYTNTYTDMAAREIKIFSTALSESDMTAIYNAEKAAYGF